MSVSVAVASDEDMPRIFEIGSLAFGNNEPIWDAFWPNHLTPAGRQAGAERMTNIKNTDPEVTYLKAFNPSTGEIMGMASWLIYENTIPPPPEFDDEASTTFFGGKDEAVHLTGLINEFLIERTGAIRRTGGNVVSLECLAVDPNFQRRGVGDALVRWGTKKADELGFEAVVESSVFGKGLYEKNGFVFVKDVKVSWPEPVQNRRSAQFAWLVRPKKDA